MDLVRYRHPGEYVTAPLAGTAFLLYDITQTPFDDPRVRRALGQAVDREMLADVILRGFVSPALGGLVPPGVPGHSPDIGLRFDPEQARRLLAEAGFPGGRGFPATELGYVPSAAEFVKHLQAQWRDNLAVKVQLQELAWHVARVREAPPPMYVAGWIADYPDPDDFLRLGMGQREPFGLDETIVKRVDDAGQCTDGEQRIAMYQEADHMVVHQAFVLPLFYMRTRILLKPWVKRHPTSPVRDVFWKEVILEPH